MLKNKPILVTVLLIILSSAISTPILLLEGQISKSLLGFINFIALGVAFIVLTHLFVAKIDKEALLQKIPTKQIGLFLWLLWIYDAVFTPATYYFFKLKSSTPDILLLIGAVVMAPIFEEYIFRYFLLNQLLAKYSKVFSLVFTTIIFALIHVNSSQIFFALFPGWVLTYVFYKFRSYKMNIILHGFSNIVSLFFISCLHYQLKNYFTYILVANLIISIVLMYRYNLLSKLRSHFITDTI